MESLSAYARQFLGQMDKPDVDFIEGLSPAISIDQKSASRNPRSTVGTITEVYDYLRLLWARIGIPHCPEHGVRLERQSPQQIVDRLAELPEGTRFQVLAPVVRGRKGEYETLLQDLAAQGFVRARIDGDTVDISEFLKDGDRLARYEQHTIEVVVDRLVRREGIERRLTDSVETALKLAEGVVEIEIVPRRGTTGPRARAETLTFSQHLACPVGGESYEELAPRNFSFNSPYGACVQCDGLGTTFEVDPELVVPNPDLSVGEGAIAPVEHGPHPVLQPDARGRGRRQRHRHGQAVGQADQGAAAGAAVRHQGPGHGQVQEPLRPGAPVLDQLRGRHPVPAAPPRRLRERLEPGAGRDLHAGGPVPRLRRRPPQAVLAGRHHRRPEHLRGLRPVDRRVGRVPGSGSS